MLYTFLTNFKTTALHLTDIEGDVERVEQSLKDLTEEIKLDISDTKYDIELESNKILNSSYDTVVDLINDSIQNLEILVQTAMTSNTDIKDCNVEVTMEEIRNLIVPEMTNLSICARTA